MSSKYVVNIYIHFDELDASNGPPYTMGEVREAHCGSDFLDDREEAIALYDRLYEAALKIVEEKAQ